MQSKQKLLGAKIYLILDRDVAGFEALFETARQAVAGGIDIIQLRDKQSSAKAIFDFSKKLVKLLKGRVPFILNDRADLASASGADGVHVGQDDLPVSLARKILGPQAIIGTSCQKWPQLKNAVHEGADYIGFGSVFKTKTKPDREPMDLNLLTVAIRKTPLPIFAIGGIDLKKAQILKTQGINRIAVCRAICEAPSPLEATKRFLKVMS